MNDEPQPTGPDECDVHVEDAWRCYLFDRCQEGERLARSAVRLAPFRGDSWYLLALNLERQRQLTQADRYFARAAQAPVNPQQPPYRVSWHRFERAFEQAADALPSYLRRALEEVTLVLRNYAAPEVIHPDSEAETLCVHLGPTRDQADHPGSNSLPAAAIHLYRRPHEHLAVDGKEFDLRLLISLIHGLGTFLGYDQERIGNLVTELA